MASDIRRMSRVELDRLNAEGKAWLEREGLSQQQPSQQTATEVIQNVQLDLWEKP